MVGDSRLTVRHVEWLLGVVALASGCSLFGGGKNYDDDDDSGGAAGQTSGTGGSTNGGSTNGGSTNGGSTNGGSTNGGSTNGGSTNGGSTNGGSTNGGSTNGGSTNGGSTNGGSTNGGSTNGGSTNGGSTNGGTTGGTTTGGAGGSLGGDTGSGGSLGGSSADGGTGGSTGGTSGAGGSSTAGCGSEWHIQGGGYVTSPGTSGCWKGFAYTVTDALGSTVTPSDFSSCTDGACSLCVSGSVTPDLDFGGYVGMGFNINQENMVDAAQGSVVPTGTGLTVSWSNTGASALRIQLQDATTQWCYNLSGTSGSLTIPYSSFMTECWEGGNSYYYSGQPITGIQLTVPGSDVYSIPYSFCLNAAKDG